MTGKLSTHTQMVHFSPIKLKLWGNKVNWLYFIWVILAGLACRFSSVIHRFIKNPNCVEITIFIRFQYQSCSAETAVLQSREQRWLMLWKRLFQEGLKVWTDVKYYVQNIFLGHNIFLRFAFRYHLRIFLSKKYYHNVEGRLGCKG